MTISSFLSSIIPGMYGSYLLDKHRWPLVFDCVRAMTTALKEGKPSTNLIDFSEKSNDEREMEKEDEGENDEKKQEEKSRKYIYKASNAIEKGEKKAGIVNERDKNSTVIPLFCKIRICEDGIDTYKATEDFCKGSVSYHTKRCCT